MEIHDNIVAYWRPESLVPEGEPYSFAYRMRWTDIIAPQLGMLVTQQTRAGLTFDGERRLFVVDFTSANGAVPQNLTAHVSGSAGTLRQPVIHGVVPGGALRVTFELETGDEPVIDLRLVLRTGETVASETWLYRWTPR
jgi:glucans biosynthesis protein